MGECGKGDAGSKLIVGRWNEDGWCRHWMWASTAPTSLLTAAQATWKQRDCIQQHTQTPPPLPSIFLFPPSQPRHPPPLRRPAAAAAPPVCQQGGAASRRETGSSTTADAHQPARTRVNLRTKTKGEQGTDYIKGHTCLAKMGNIRRCPETSVVAARPAWNCSQPWAGSACKPMCSCDG